jgi:hypothetical protein
LYVISTSPPSHESEAPANSAYSASCKGAFEQLCSAVNGQPPSLLTPAMATLAFAVNFDAATVAAGGGG